METKMMMNTIIRYQARMTNLICTWAYLATKWVIWKRRSCLLRVGATVVSLGQI